MDCATRTPCACWSSRARRTSPSSSSGARASIETRSGRLSRGREAAHSVRRVLHAGDTTGREIGRVLWNRVSALPSVETANHALVTELLVEDGRVAGVRFFDQLGFPRDARARATLLATGGAGHVFRETTNPPVATGDGVALAFHAGARVADLEFVQFHPTALNVRGAPALSDFRSAARRRRQADQRPRRGVHDALPSRRRPRAARRRRPEHRARDGADRRVGVPVALASGPGLRRPPVSDDCRHVPPDQPRPGDRSDSRRARGALHHGRRRTRTSGAGRPFRACSPPARWRARAFTAPTVWPATRCSRGSCSARARPTAMQESRRQRQWRLDRQRGCRPLMHRGSTDHRSRVTSQRASDHAPSLTTSEVRDLMWKSVGLFRTGEGLRRRRRETRSGVLSPIAARSTMRALTMRTRGSSSTS